VLPTETEPAVQLPVDIETVGGVVIVGTMGQDAQGWYIQPEQPLNITYQYFLDAPSVFREQTRIAMFDPKDDGVEKAFYLGQTVTAEGIFRFFRDDFETLYFVPYTITMGKNVPQSHSAPELVAPEEPRNLYDPSIPLPAKMDPVIQDGRYVYNAYRLSEETLEFMGNGFAVFYAEFVDALLNYRTEVPCPDRDYAEMLSSIIYYELPLYNACAEPFEFFKHYDPEQGTVSIVYQHDKETFEETKAQFFNAADTFLADTSPDRTDEENARSIYHALCTRMTYDYSALTEFERKESYYAYLHHSGVCVTFANVYNQLLNQVGIKTTVAHCDSDETIGHSWSVITLDGLQYFCDPTYELSYDSGAGYRFFGMSYADRTQDGTGVLGIRYGRYDTNTMTPDMIAEESLGN
jgi:transglutaminase-like putative cysteine protease